MFESSVWRPLARRREFRRLRALPRRTRAESSLAPSGFTLIDGPSFVPAYQEIFLNQVYRFPCHTPRPRILDCGANVGLASVFCGITYPGARITAFEPDATIYAVLRENCQRYGLHDVDLVNAAVWSTEGSIPFRAEGSDSGRVVGTGDNQLASVPTVRLRDYLREPVDLLKLDVEGAELEVLEDCADALGPVSNLFVEIHSSRDEPQMAGQVLSLLTDAGFRYHVRTDLSSDRPFIGRSLWSPLDNLLNVWAYRVDEGIANR